MPVTFQKNVTEITERDIAGLITNQVRENLNLEYKEAMYSRGDEDTREMLRDITSIANAQGGHILIGIKEDDQNEGIPTELKGVDEPETVSSRMTSSCLSNIDERIPGLQIHPVPLSNGKHIILIRIPKSPKAPHMVTFKGLNQFWKRHDRQKSRMSAAEIKEACNATEQLMIKMEQFLERRKENVLKNASGKPLYLISTTPYFLGDDLIDIYDQNIRALITHPPDQRTGGRTVECSSLVMPSLNGLISEYTGYKSLEMFRNGHCEFKVNIERPSSGFICNYVDPKSQKGPILRSLNVVEYVVSFLGFYKKVYEYLSIIEPVVISVKLLNIKGYGLYRFRSGEEDIDPPVIWHDEHLEIPQQAISFFESRDKIAGILCDRIWNAFNYEKAPYFDEDGHFIPPN